MDKVYLYKRFEPVTVYLAMSGVILKINSIIILLLALVTCIEYTSLERPIEDFFYYFKMLGMAALTFLIGVFLGRKSKWYYIKLTDNQVSFLLSKEQGEVRINLSDLDCIDTKSTLILFRLRNNQVYFLDLKKFKSISTKNKIYEWINFQKERKSKGL